MGKENENLIIAEEDKTSSAKPKRIPWNKGKKCPYATEFMKRDYASGKRVSPTKGKSSWNKGIPWSEEHRENAMEGRSKVPVYRQTPEHKAIMLEVHLGRKNTEEVKQKMSEIAKNRKRVKKIKKSNRTRLIAFESRKPRDFKVIKKKKISKPRVCKPWSDERRKLMSDRMKGRVFTPEHRENLARSNRERLLGKKREQEIVDKMSKNRKGITPWNKGVPCAEETRIKISVANTGKTHPSIPCAEETKIKIGAANKGKKRTDEVRKQISERCSGEKHYNWKGGISSEPYPFEFNKELKKEIYKRDEYKCQLCQKPFGKGNGKFAVHHINYCKTDISYHNLITLCHSCHSKTNGDREFYNCILKPLTYDIIGEVCI